MLQRIVRWGQWAAIIALPAWLFLGSVLFVSGGGWYVFALLFAVPVLAVLLLVGPLISLAVPRSSRSAATATSAVLNVALWVVVLVIPFVLEEAGDGPTGPSIFERLGMPSTVDQLILLGLVAAIPFLLIAIWTTNIVAASAGRRRRGVTVTVTQDAVVESVPAP